MAEKNRYSDEELEEFRQIINEKLEVAQRDYDALKCMFPALYLTIAMFIECRYPFFFSREVTKNDVYHLQT